MKVTVYGSNVCTKTLHDLNVLWDKGYQVDFVNVTGSIGLLKDFVHMRDVNPVFDPIRKEGRFGTPFFVLEDGTETHELEEVLRHKG